VTVKRVPGGALRHELCGTGPPEPSCGLLRPVSSPTNSPPAPGRVTGDAPPAVGGLGAHGQVDQREGQAGEQREAAGQGPETARGHWIVISLLIVSPLRSTVIDRFEALRSLV
jgi:hypothetical protein